MTFVVSIALGLGGVVLTRALTVRLRAGHDPHAPWSLGLVAVLPAWFVTFLALLGTEPGVTPPVIAFATWVLSAAAALGGAIATEAALRRQAEQPGHRVTDGWRLGVLAMLPAWALATIGLLLR